MSPKKNGNTNANSIALAPRSRRREFALLTRSPPVALLRRAAASPRSGTGAGDRTPEPEPLPGDVLELVRDLLEDRLQARAGRGERPDHDDRDQARDQSVLDRSRAPLLGEQSPEEFAHLECPPLRQRYSWRAGELIGAERARLEDGFRRTRIFASIGERSHRAICEARRAS